MSSVCVEDLASDLEQLTVLHDDSDGSALTVVNYSVKNACGSAVTNANSGMILKVKNYQERTSQNGLLGQVQRAPHLW